MLTLLPLLLVAAPNVAVLSTVHETTELRFQPLGNSVLAPVAAVFTHADGESVRGATVGARVVAIAPLARVADWSFASSLLRLEAGRAPVVLVGQVVGASRPVVSKTGRVFVARGRAGSEVPRSFRVDTLQIDEVNVENGAVATLYATTGSFTYCVGFSGDELLVYELAAAGARLIAVNVDSRAVRVVRRVMPPLAHDFSVDEAGHRLVYTLGVPGVEVWELVETRTDTGESRVLASGPSVAMLPTVLPDGRVARSAGAGAGLVEVESGAVVLAARGPGYERVRFFSQGVAIGLHEVPSGFAEGFAVPVTSKARAAGGALTLLVPEHARVELAGVLP